MSYPICPVCWRFIADRRHSACVEKVTSPLRSASIELAVYRHDTHSTLLCAGAQEVSAHVCTVAGLCSSVFQIRFKRHGLLASQLSSFDIVPPFQRLRYVAFGTAFPRPLRWNRLPRRAVGVDVFVPLPWESSQHICRVINLWVKGHPRDDRVAQRPILATASRTGLIRASVAHESNLIHRLHSGSLQIHKQAVHHPYVFD